MTWTNERLAAAGLQPPERRVDIPGSIQHVAEILAPWLGAQSEKTALIGRHRSLTYGQIDAEVNAAAAWLRSLGVGEGTRVAASLANHPEIVIAFLAVQRLAAIWVGINLAYSPFEKAYMLEDADASVFLAERKVIEGMAEAGISPDRLRIVEVSPEGGCEWSQGMTAHAGTPAPDVSIDPWAPAGIAYTSGTTGRPKGTVHTQHNMMTAAAITEIMAGYTTPDAVRATVSPLTILNMMIGGPLATLAAGQTHVCCDRIDVEGIAEWIARARINTMALVPTIIRDLLTSPAIRQEDLASLKWVVIGAAMVPEGMAELYHGRFGHAPTIGYGLTEAPTIVSRTHAGTPRIQGAIGRPAPHLHVAILDEAGAAVPAGEEGEICVRAIGHGEWAHVYTPPLGYWNKPDATRELLAGGWLHTGDMGRLDETGELFISARRSDLIVRGGANIYPAEVERVILQVPGVADCAVLGAPDERLGEVVAAFIEARADADESALVERASAECMRQLAKYKVPVRWQVLGSFPRNAMGKTVKPELRKLLDAQSRERASA